MTKKEEALGYCAAGLLVMFIAIGLLITAITKQEWTPFVVALTAAFSGIYLFVNNLYAVILEATVEAHQKIEEVGSKKTSEQTSMEG